MRITQQNFLYSISKIRQNLFSFLEGELSAQHIHDISPSDGDILFVLDGKGALSIQEIASLTIKDKSTVSPVIKKLEERGYVTKERGEDDGRSVKIKLTSKSHKIKPALWKISASMNQRLFRGLDEEERARLFELLGKVYNNVEKLNEHPGRKV